LRLFYHGTSAPTCSSSYSTYGNISSLGTGKCHNLSFNRYNTPPGNLTSWVLADGGCVITEADENNNTASATVGYGSDLYVSSFSVAATIFKATYTASICNKGDPITTGITVGLYNNATSEPGCTTKVDQTTNIAGLAKNACATVTFTWATPPGGSYKGWIKADPTCAIAELNETNNAASASYDVKTDFYIAAFSVKTSKTSYKVDYSISVCNQGAASNSPFNLGLYFHATAAPGCTTKPDMVWTVPSLSSGLCTTRTFSRASAPPGSYTGYARADTDCKWVELLEANNNKAVKYTVGQLPDLQVSQLTATATKNKIDFSSTVCNKGAAVKGPFLLGLWHNRSGKPTCSVTPDQSKLILSLGAGACYTHSFTHYASKPGVYLGWVLVDAQCKVPETLETNNTASSGYLVMTMLPDAGVADAMQPDGYYLDGSGPDLSPDAGVADLGPPDLGPPDLGPPDLGPPDLGPPDLASPDAASMDGLSDANLDSAADAGPDTGGAADVGGPDTSASVDTSSGVDTISGPDGTGSGQDGGSSSNKDTGASTGGDAATQAPSDGGCDCRAGGAGSTGGAPALLGLLLSALLARFRRRKRRR